MTAANDGKRNPADEKVEQVLQQIGPGSSMISPQKPGTSFLEEPVQRGAVALRSWIDADAGPRVIKEVVFRASMELRTAGLIQGEPAQFSFTDQHRFASSLNRLLTQMIRGKRAI